MASAVTQHPAKARNDSSVSTNQTKVASDEHHDLHTQLDKKESRDVEHLENIRSHLVSSTRLSSDQIVNKASCAQL
jgi:hypothetical protein